MLDENDPNPFMAKCRLIGYYIRNNYHRLLHRLERGRLASVRVLKLIWRFITRAPTENQTKDAPAEKKGLLARIATFFQRFFSASQEAGEAAFEASVEISKAGYQIATMVVTLFISMLQSPIRIAIMLGIFWFIYVEMNGGWDQFF